jgi:hypothetical protein
MPILRHGFGTVRHAALLPRGSPERGNAPRSGKVAVLRLPAAGHDFKLEAPDGGTVSGATGRRTC